MSKIGWITLKHFMFTDIVHSDETIKIFFKADFGKKSRDWFNATNDEDNIKCVST